ncbi:hypothetical protein [uncultured Clostridium sp.]|jgi:hypothetical protein|uniref:hypothetical protein n=1 Tax=uncultured Clostridium sp. TaxID=59620 RepID=UPI0025CC3CFE|nr:hypothetical protein [uncultured Clostridium sp.]
MSKKKRKFQWQQVIPFIIFLFIGGIIGYYTGNSIGDYIATMKVQGMSKSMMLFKVFILLVGIYVVVMLQIIIHEGGHLIAGLLSGYKFSSFRVFNFMWIKEDGKLKLKKLSLVGTGGQCLMVPPDLKDGVIPYKLYNLGGSLLNIIVSLIALGIYILWSGENLVTILLLVFSVVGIIFAIMNGIPLRVGGIDNDGYNTLSLGKNKSALQAFWVQMKVNELISKGIRLKDMPHDLFLMPNDKEMNNSMVAAKAVFACNRLIDEHKFEEAEKLIHRLLEIDTAMALVHRNLMICDEIYCKAILGSSKEDIDLLLDKNQKKFMKAMKNFPSVLRTEYAYAIIIEKNKDKAEKVKNQFNKISSTYPYKADIESEYELMEIADKKINYQN